MRTEPLPQMSHQIGMHPMDRPTDIQFLMHSAWLLAGIAIALAGCTAADEADLHAIPADPNLNVAHSAPQPNAQSGNVQDLTY